VKGVVCLARGGRGVQKPHVLRNGWWQTGGIYQIYPRSFQDSNGDGIGDLRGIASRLDYLRQLGVDAIWISPIYPSPMADFGYDVTDFCGIHPDFGALADFDAVLTLSHSLGLRLILDYVPNHTSDQHPWFVESRSSPSRKRDWYIWRDGKPDGSPPTNWLSEFGGSAWTFDPHSSQFYYHAYLKEQPDLNWRNPDVRAAMLDVMRFWLDRGVDGLRVDAIHHLIESDELIHNPPNPDWRPGMSPARRLLRVYTMDQPEVHEAIAAMRRLSDEYNDRVLIGEAYLPLKRLMAYYGVNLRGFQLPFNFQLIAVPWQATSIATLIDAYEKALPTGAWPTRTVRLAAGRGSHCHAVTQRGGGVNDPRPRIVDSAPAAILRDGTARLLQDEVRTCRFDQFYGINALVGFVSPRGGAALSQPRRRSSISPCQSTFMKQ
jgi:alpha-glucosidase